MEIKLTQNSIALIDKEDAPLVKHYCWGLSCHNYTRYAITWFTHPELGPSSYVIYMHRLILGAGPNDVCDHINRNGLDNRRSNLRLCTSSQNGSAKIIDSAGTRSGYRGVWPSVTGQRWEAVIKHKRQRYFLGHYATPVEAAAARDIAAIELHGEFATLNNVAGATLSAEQVNLIKDRIQQ